MRDDLHSFVFLGRRVCVNLDKHNERGWTYVIDGNVEPQRCQHLSYEDRLKLEEAGMVARDRIRLLQSVARSNPLAHEQGRPLH